MKPRTDVEKARINFLKRKEPPTLTIESKSEDFKRKKLEKDAIKQELKKKFIEKTESPMQLEPEIMKPEIINKPVVPQENKQTKPPDENKLKPNIDLVKIEPVISKEKKEVILPKVQEPIVKKEPVIPAKTFYPPDEILSEEMSEEDSESIEFIPTQRRDVQPTIPRTQTVSRPISTTIEKTQPPIEPNNKIEPQRYLSEETMAKIKDHAYNMGSICVSRLGAGLVIVVLAFMQSWAQAHVARRSGIPVATINGNTIIKPMTSAPIQQENMANLANNFPSFFRQ